MKNLAFRINHFKKRVVRRLQRELEFDRISNELMSVLDSAVDITQCKPATGMLREIQLADTELLRLFDLLCQKNGLTYWLDWGTLLGAVRHKGFIPWDDDLDVCMPREDFLRAADVLTDYFKGREGFQVSEREASIKEDRIWVVCWKASVLIDIFPIESTTVKKGASKDAVAMQVIACRNGDPASAADGSAEGSEKIYYYRANVWNTPGFFPESALFPLKKVPFEQYELNAPNDFDYCLSVQYGNYMAFPRGGVLHHRGLNENDHYSAEASREAVKAMKTMQMELLNQDETEPTVP